MHISLFSILIALQIDNLKVFKYAETYYDFFLKRILF